MKAFSVSIQSDSKVPEGFGVTNKEIMRIAESEVSMNYCICPKDWKNTSRKMGVCEARQVFQYFLRTKTSYSLAEIGYYAGKLDHADVVHNVKKIKDLSFTYPQFSKMIKTIDAKIDEEIKELIKINLAS